SRFIELSLRAAASGSPVSVAMLAVADLLLAAADRMPCPELSFSATRAMANGRY
ncbi:unnamed protein product, partial [Urochloa humidicola]